MHTLKTNISRDKKFCLPLKSLYIERKHRASDTSNVRVKETLCAIDGTFTCFFFRYLFIAGNAYSRAGLLHAAKWKRVISLKNQPLRWREKMRHRWAGGCFYRRRHPRRSDRGDRHQACHLARTSIIIKVFSRLIHCLELTLD